MTLFRIEILFVDIKACIDARGEPVFQYAIGLSSDNFLALLVGYLKSTFILLDNQLYLQKKGICNGSCLAPLLCEPLLSEMDITLDNCM